MRAEYPAGVARRPVDVHDRQEDLQLGVGQRLAGLVVDELGQAADVADQVGLPGEQPRLPLLPAQPRPPGRRLPGPLDGCLDLGPAVDREGGDHLGGGGIDRVEGLRLPGLPVRPHRVHHPSPSL